ncbi:MAG: stage II sporulation protein D [Clostridia bacterium]|nr:stage II sporulation protein D [Clostridia bacterium]
MKKYIIIFIIFIIMIFLLPVLFTKQFKFIDENSKLEENNNQEEKQETEIYNYKEFSTIKLLHSFTGEIEEIPLDTYLLGVVSAEMPANFEQEALKAQAVVARTYTIYSISHNNGKHNGADICDSPKCCQAWISKENRLSKWEEEKKDEYWDKIVNAVETTKGKVITYEGEIIDAFFHANSGGTTETPVNVWGGTSFPYLQAVETSGEDAYSQYNSEVSMSKDEFKKVIKDKYSDFNIEYNNNCIEVLEYTDSGRVKKIRIGNLELSGVEVRSLLGLKSSNFQVIIGEENIKFEVTGYGHGVGMSQTGADSMAKNGSNYIEIIKHFYTGVEIVDL